MFYFNMVFFVNFGTILEGFGIPNGGQDGPKMGKIGIKKATSDRCWIFGRFRGDFGRFGRGLGGLGQGL